MPMGVYRWWMDVGIHPLRLVIVNVSVRRLQKAPDLGLPFLPDSVGVARH